MVNTGDNPGGLKTSYEYDTINRVTEVTTTKNGASVNTFAYEYDNNGNTTKEIRNGKATSYSYDNLDRLISVTYSDGTSVTYEYDALNNRTKETYSNGDVKTYLYDEKYQLKEIRLNGQVTDTFTYNAAGAVVTHNEKTFTYDEWDRMLGYSDGTNTYTYKYDANGIRTQKNDKQYVIEINNNVVAETDSTGAVIDEILWGHQPLARKINGSWYYYIYNAHGDVVGLVNSAGTVVNTYEYTPWGEMRSESETVDNPIKYAGEYYDEELEMIYLRARYYNPKIGRFTSLDIEEGEIVNPLDMNRYVYCRNNPIRYVDPTGREGVAVTMLWDAFLGGGASKDYSYNWEIVRTFYASPNLNKVVDNLFSDFKNTGLSSKTYTGSLGFYGNDWNPNDLDLHLAAGLANYSMTFTKEVVKKRFLWMTWEETVYNVQITVSDTYDFDEYREGTSVSNWLNNWGYDMQKKGHLTPYYWSVKFRMKGL